MEFEQGQFNFEDQGDDSGYQSWLLELAERRRNFQSRYGIIIGSRVRLTLIGEDLPLEGIISVCDAREPANRSKLHLRLGHRKFLLAQIESISRLDGQHPPEPNC